MNEFETLPPVAALPSFKLSGPESAALLLVVNGVRSGAFAFQVMFTYDKVTNAKPRIAPTDYKPIPGTTAKYHVGTVVKAPTNKHGKVFLLVRDAARALDSDAGWTAVRPEGITSFAVLPNGVLPGVAAVAAVKHALAKLGQAG